MAKRGDIVECHCGALCKLENDRVPWHKRPGTRFNCTYSGAAAEGWDAVSVVVVEGVPLGLACPACASRVIGNGPGAGALLVCRECGVAGTVAEFLADAVRKHAARGEGAKSRYGAR